MKLLIFGGDGYVGSPAARYFVASGQDVTEKVSIRQLANLVRSGSADVALDGIVNRHENCGGAAGTLLQCYNTASLLQLGLEPALLFETLVESMFSVIGCTYRMDEARIAPEGRWPREPAVG